LPQVREPRVRRPVVRKDDRRFSRAARFRAS
jgi:hypothetical protein